MKYRTNIAAMILIFLFTATGHIHLFSQEAKEEKIQVPKQEILNWLVLGPAAVPKITKEVLKSDGALVSFGHIDVSGLEPAAQAAVPWNAGSALTWKESKRPYLKSPGGTIYYLAAYLETDRWLQTSLALENTGFKAEIYLDGKKVNAKITDKTIGADLELTNEKHLLLVKLLLTEDKPALIEATLQNKEAFKDEKIKLSLTPRHRLTPVEILNTIEIGSIDVSPDGKRAAVFLKQAAKGTGKTERWFEVINTYNGAVVFSSRSTGNLSRFNWMGNSDTFSYADTEKEKSTIYKYRLSSHQRTVILKDVDKFSSYWWAPDMSYMIYSTYKKKKEEKTFKHVKTLDERSRFSQYTTSMYIYYPGAGAGTRHRISTGKENYGSARISPDSKKIIFSKNEPDIENRPYSKNFYYLFDVATFSIQPLLEGNWINSVQWAPDSRKLLVIGGASCFDGLGKNLKTDAIPNEDDGQAYIYHLDSKKAEAISKDFNPSIRSASWRSSTSYIYFKVIDKEDEPVYKYSVTRKNYRRLTNSVEIVSRIDYAAKRNIALFRGCSANVPYKLYRLDLGSGKTSLLKDYNRNIYKNVDIGTVADCNFTTEEGVTIYGRLHFPVGFDKTRKYPCIVYYYGGISPVTRSFGGRYPYNWYTANGYIVYVLQPSGAVGFSQDFSAIHVNDWGKTTSAEIIAGAKQLVKAHPYIDEKRLGAMGASYGGFMTMYLATQTDIFAGFISHAGISSLSSYWGIGDYGVWYSALATAGSFPWNRKDIYVGHSPLYMADRITTPLLLLHGDIDNNVPPGESYQMYAALKLQGKDVALIMYKDQSHWIMEYERRIHWYRTIIAWWDKYLKGQPEHWEHMYGK